MGLVRKESKKLGPTPGATNQKDPDTETVSYQKDAASKSKMGPTSSTVEGSE